MSYFIAIGNKFIETEEDGDVEKGRYFIETPPHEIITKSPRDLWTFCHDNTRSPAYASWYNFVEELGLYEMFHSENGLFNQEDQCVELTAEHDDAIKDALDRYTAQPAQLPYMLARLQWLHYRVHWAVTSCPCPAIYHG